MSVCDQCGREFLAMCLAQLRCGPACRNRAAKDRRLARLTEGGPCLSLCPCPSKKAYSTWDEAEKRRGKHGVDELAYKCRCGAIHYGHSPDKPRPPGASWATPPEVSRPPLPAARWWTSTP